MQIPLRVPPFLDGYTALRAMVPSPDLERFFASLQSRIEGRRKTHEQAATRTREDMRVFFGALGPIRGVAQKAQNVLDRHAATSFSVFHYFHASEPDLSRIFAGLLDPSGADGQGDLFLALFLEELQRSSASSEDGAALDLLEQVESIGSEQCSVSTEYVIPNQRRIDIVVRLPGNRWIGIENKPWAREQEDQVKDYLRALLDESSSENALVVFLSGSGVEPTTGPEEHRNHCLTMSYRDYSDDAPSLEHWLQRCYEKCEAERVRWFLKDVLEYVRRTFSDQHHEGRTYDDD